ncbi:MAG: hypothetical protein GY793_05790 [Proteobacteria bacterium]|nr:hypothetical protein [Pseudomonadota bacterium]
MKNLILLITLMCLSFNAWAEETKAKNYTLEELLKDAAEAKAKRERDPEYQKFQKLCKKILKNEQKDMTQGYFITKNGRVSLNEPEHKGFEDLSLQGKCSGFMNLPNLHSYYAYKHPTLKDQYLIYRYELIGSRVDYELYIYDINICKKTKVFDDLGFFRPRNFSYAMYNDDLYGIFRSEMHEWNIKKKSWYVWNELPPNIINLSDDSHTEYNCYN